MDGNWVIIKLFFQPVARPTAGQPGKAGSPPAGREITEKFLAGCGEGGTAQNKSDSVFASPRNKRF